MYDIAGPYVELKPYGRGGVEIYPDPHLEAGLGISGSVGGSVKVLWIELANINYELFDFYKAVWEQEITNCFDADGDGYLDASCKGTDCDDTDPSINPSAREICGDGIDNNCANGVDEGCGDTTPPETTITSGPSDPSGGDVTFAFTCNEANCTYECRLDGGAWTTCTSPQNYTGLSDGVHTFEVRSTDSSGNTDVSPAVWTWTVDTTLPGVAITSYPSDPTNSTTATFEFTSSEQGVTFECQLDGGGWSTCTSPKTYSGLSEGNHTFEVRAKDPAGNTDPSPANYSWSINLSPGGSEIIVYSCDGELWKVDPDGTNPVRILSTPNLSALTVSPDRLWIYYTANYGTDWEIYKVQVDGTSETNLTNSSGSDGHPSVSSGSQYIYFHTYRDGNYNIYRMNTDGSGQTQITSLSAYEGMPDISPDGSKIVYTNDETGSYDLFIMNSDGTGKTQITDWNGMEYDGRWSPDGSRIVFVYEDSSGIQNIYIYDVGAGTFTQITSTSTNSREPRWSPDGNYIIYTEDFGNYSHIYKYSLSTGTSSAFITNCNRNSYAFWR